MNEILIILSLASLTNLLVEAEPIVMFRRWIGFKDENYIDYSKTKQFIMRLITCALCTGTYISLLGLSLHLKWYLLPIIPIVAELINKKIKQ